MISELESLGDKEAVRGAMRMNAYRAIKRSPGRGKDRLRPSTTIDLHKASVEYISACLRAVAESDVVVVTHHAPLPRNRRGYPGEKTGFDPAFIVEIEPRFRPAMKVWPASLEPVRGNRAGLRVGVRVCLTGFSSKDGACSSLERRMQHFGEAGACFSRGLEDQ